MLVLATPVYSVASPEPAQWYHRHIIAPALEGE